MTFFQHRFATPKQVSHNEKYSQLQRQVRYVLYMSAAFDSNPDFVKALYCDHHGWLHGWLRKKLGNHEMAADLAHDTFIKLLAGQQSTTVSLREPRAFLTTLASRLLIDHNRHQKIEQAYLAELALVSENVSGCSPESVFMAIQALKQFSDALEDMPSKAREAFILHYLDEVSQSEIAAHLGVSVRMVQKYLAQALLKCHAVLFNN